MKKKFSSHGPKNLLLFIVFTVGTLLIISWLAEYANNNPSINYTTFLSRVEKGDVRMVRVSGQNVQGKFKNGDAPHPLSGRAADAPTCGKWFGTMKV